MRKKRSFFILLTFLILLFISAGFYSFFGPVPSENRRFDTYTEEFFCQEVSGNTISLHYTLKDPSKYNIKNAPVTLGYYSTDSDARCASVENALALLTSHNRAKLTEENQLTYDVLEHYLTSLSIVKPRYALYEEPLAPLTGYRHSFLSFCLNISFIIRKTQTLLKLLAQTPEYFQSILDFEKEKSRQKLFMSESRADAIITECKKFMSLQENNYLYSSLKNA